MYILKLSPEENKEFMEFVKKADSVEGGRDKTKNEVGLEVADSRDVWMIKEMDEC